MERDITHLRSLSQRLVEQDGMKPLPPERFQGQSMSLKGISRIILAMMLITFAPIQVEAQNNTQTFPSTIWSVADGMRNFTLGDISTLNGIEINLWLRPTRVNDDDRNVLLMKVLQYIEINYYITQTPTNQLINGFLLKYAGKVYNGTVTMNNGQWLNMNFRLQFSTYITLSFWEGNYNVNPAPSMTLTHPNPQAFTSNVFQLMRLTSDLYMDYAEIRIFELDISRSFGQYFKYNFGIWPQPSDFAKQRQYYTAYGSILYLDINNNTMQVTNIDQKPFQIDRCPYGQFVGDVGSTVSGATKPTQVEKYSKECNYCLTQDCLVCPSAYLNKNTKTGCKICKKGSALCTEDTQECPVDYYLANGICQRCLPGCSSCTSATQCTACDAGLRLVANLTHTVCKCIDTYYGVANYATDTLTCSSCDASIAKCANCQDANNYCLSCQPNLYLADNTCVSNCASLTSRSYTDVARKMCVRCGEGCGDCINSTQCKPLQCYYNATMKYYNNKGLCVSQCPDDTVLVDASKSCESCGDNCAICGNSTTNCTICNQGYFLEGGACVKTCTPGKYGDTSNVCQYCNRECVLCLAQSQCTKCLNAGPNATDPTNWNDRYFFVNYQCKLDCPDRYYKDKRDDYDLFCRSCPSGCLQCTDEYTCTVCDVGWYLDNFYNNTRFLCVNKCQPGSYPVNLTAITTVMTCNKCLTGCEICDNTTHCAKCSQGLVLQRYPNGTFTCAATCPTGRYVDANNVCQDCITGCVNCNNNYTCNKCDFGYFKVDDTENCVPTTCPDGYFQNMGTNGNNCTNCKPECRTCSGKTTCDTCIIGYSLAPGGRCLIKCGDKNREDNEECDDGNIEDGDGCSSDCKVEPGFVCMPLDTTTLGPDLCFCDAQPQSASWTEFWGQIEITFASQIIYNPAFGPKSSDATIFCSQILDPTMLANNLLGTDYSCFLESSPSGSSIRINVDLDSTLGNNQMNFTTKIVLNFDALRVKDCQTSIPLTYTLTNLPLDSPTVYFQTSLNGLVVPKCASYYGLNIFTSKGFTKRDVDVQWNILSMNPDDSELKAELQTYLDNNYKKVKYFEFTADQIERLAGKSILVKVIVTNFLGLQGSNFTTIQFSNQKAMMLVDLLDIYTFAPSMENTLAPRVRIPYCSNDAADQQSNDLQQVQLSCTLYSFDLLKKTPLANCTIPAFNMTLGQPYKVKVQAVNLKDPNMGVTKWVHIDTASPSARIAYIEGCNRLFSVNNSFDLEAMISTNASYAKFNWFCTDSATGSPCFTTSFSYITMANTKKVNIAGGQFFANNTYNFKVIVFDTLSQTEVTKECLMYAAPIDDQVLDIMINTEANKNGFIDFNAQMAAFKVQTIGSQTLDRNNLKFKWKFTDSSGTVFKDQDLKIYQNALGVMIAKLERSNIYKVEANVTYGSQTGYIKTFFETEPKMTFEFSVEPNEGEPHKTIFTFSVTSQDTVDGLYSYVFGYVNPVDGISNIPIYQRSTNRYQRTQLPVPEGKTYLTCYVQVMLPSGESKTYQQNVTMSFPSITVTEFKTQLSNAVMDDLVESMQMMNKLVTLRSKMTLADRSYAIRQILKGLQGETTPLSDYNIQSSVSSLLEYISKEAESLLSDPKIATVAAQLFQQITIGENKDITLGRYSQFGRAATLSLYNFANNLFQLDLTSVIGGRKSYIHNLIFFS